MTLLLVPLSMFLTACDGANQLTPQQRAAISGQIQTGVNDVLRDVGVLAGLRGLDQPVWIKSPDTSGGSPVHVPGLTVPVEGSFFGAHPEVYQVEIRRQNGGHESYWKSGMSPSGDWSFTAELARGVNVFTARAALGAARGPWSNAVEVQADQAPALGPPPVPAQTDSFALDFDPARDGFAMVNDGSQDFPGGECYGMVSFASWYSMNKRDPSGPGLFSQFQEKVTFGDQEVTGQDAIATLATYVYVYGPNYRSLDGWWKMTKGYLGTASSRQVPLMFGNMTRLTDTARYEFITEFLRNRRTPVILAVSAKEGGHAVLAYAYDKGRVSVYDPNVPGEVQYVVYDRKTGKFEDYTAGGHTFTNLNYAGDVPDSVNAPFEEILRLVREEIGAASSR